jgi:antitoxin component of MazEF toxin-antitoxin module
MMQKLITVGNSKALTISRQILKQVGDVDMAKVQFEPSKKRLIVDFDPKEVVDSVVDPEVYSVAKSLLKRYDKAFAELAKK